MASMSSSANSSLVSNLGGDEGSIHGFIERTYRFTSATWRQSILNMMLQQHSQDIHRSIAQALEAESFGEDLSNVEDNRCALALFAHWKAACVSRKAIPMAIEIGKRYENWGFSPQSIEVYESGLEMLVVGVGGSEDGGSADVGGEKCHVVCFFAVCSE